MKKMNKLFPYVPLMFGILYFYYISCSAVLYGDDLVYIHNLDGKSVLQWCKEFYCNWGGRVPLQLLDIIFLYRSVKLWRFFNTVIMTVNTVYTVKIAKLFNKNLKGMSLFLLITFQMILFVFMPQPTFNDGAIWITGSFNYLLPCAMLVMSLYPFIANIKEVKISKLEYMLSYLSVLLCCYAEQTAAVFVCMAIICLLIQFVQKKCVSKDLIFLLIFGSINCFVMFMAPGNKVRYDAELICWYQTFDTYNMFDKIVVGLIHTTKVLMQNGFIYFAILLLFMGLMTYRKDKELMFSYLFLCFITFVNYHLVYNLTDEVVWQIYSIRTLITIGMLCFWILYFSWFLFYLLKDDMNLSVVTSMLLLATFCAGIVMGMSPTIYASGLRVFFVCYILLILLDCTIFSYLLNYVK
ncbi:MAG: hypothetical protein JTJ28_13455 [Lactobacillus sp.]|nr:hypothetical protein [Lactobacillus sp.]